MPVITGNATVDAIIITVCGVGVFVGGLMFKFLKELMSGKDEPNFGRRAEDVEKVRDTQADHGTRIAVCETRLQNMDEKVDALAAGQETQRLETRENFKGVFEQLATISTDVAKIARNGNGGRQ